MTKIQRVSRILQIVFIIFFITLPVMQTFYWLYYPIPCTNHAFCASNLPPNLELNTLITFGTRLQGWLVNLIPTAIEMFSFYCLIRLFKLYEQQKIFTADNVRYIRNIGIAFILNELINPFIQALTSLIMTAHNGPGKHIVAISITSYNFTNIIIGVIILMISWVMSEACKLQEEQTYTV